MDPINIGKIFERLSVERPNPTTELQYSSPFELLIAVMLSAQMTDSGVNRTTQKLFPIANTPEALLALGEEKLAFHIRSINYYNAKAAHVIRTCKILIEQHHSQVPDNRVDLEELPGVGRKTANVILNTLFGHSTIAVDTHVFRVSNRTGIAPGKTTQAVETKLHAVIPKAFLQDAHHWLVLHGRYVCTAKNPRCKTCVINDLCEYPDKNL